MTLEAPDFATFFRAVHGVDPFAWQRRLAEQVLDGGWPQAIDVPTGMGKTAVVDVAVFALAAQAELPPDQRTTPTRTFVVVNRRVIVDQTHERASRLKESLDLSKDEIVQEVARRLRRLSVGAGSPRPLDVVRMRGGLSWSWRWLESPAQPAVITGTVDQYGSRLLFRGYGVGDYLRPIDAALSGTDRLLILDEAHLSWPFVQTALTIDEHESRAEASVLRRRRPRPVLMSATPPLGRLRRSDVFVFEPVDETGAVAQDRLAAQRHVHLLELKGRKEEADRDLAQALATLGAELVAGHQRVAVVCNTVATARRVFSDVQNRLKGVDPPARIALLTGRCRQIDRERIDEDWVRTRLSPESREEADDHVIAVATQTIEVGADIDVDALVTEAAPMDALLQRLGRLDRRGARGRSDAYVIYSPRRDDDAPVYGPATARTWGWLKEQAGHPKPTLSTKLLGALKDAPSLEMGPMNLGVILDRPTRATLATEPPLAPIVLAPSLAAWARTSPRPDPDQEVAPFLHGLERGQPEVLICWRAGLPKPAGDQGLEVWKAELESAPVRAHETVAIPIFEANRFLRGDVAPGPDIVGEALEPDGGEVSADVAGVAQSSDGEVRALAPGTRLRPDDTVVLASATGGYDGWGWTGRHRDAPVVDVADVGPGRRARLRLRIPVLEGILGGPSDDLQLPTADDREANLSATVALIGKRAREAGTPYSQLLERLCTDLRDGCRSMVVEREACSWRVLTRTRGAEPTLPDAVGDGTDDGEAEPVSPGSSSAGSQPIDLDQHLRDVGRRARSVAETLGLDRDLVSSLELAGLGHDLGKSDNRFQAMLYGGDALMAEATGRTLAKSGMDPNDRDAFRRAARLSGLPRGMRHEAQSAALLVALLDGQPGLLGAAERDLVCHLVASHHGRGRPLLPGVLDQEPVAVTARLPGAEETVTLMSDAGLVDWESPNRFRRLGARYGWWGLALLETVLRLADIAVSEEYNDPDDSAREDR